MARLVRRLSVPDQALCRRRLPGTGVPERGETDSGARQRRDRQAIGSSHRVRRTAQALDRRTHLRLARPLPTTGQGLGNVSTTRPSPSCASPPSASCCENYAIPHDVLGQTLPPKTDRRAPARRRRHPSPPPNANLRSVPTQSHIPLKLQQTRPANAIKSGQTSNPTPKGQNHPPRPLTSKPGNPGAPDTAPHTQTPADNLGRAKRPQREATPR